jgi:hypothetical protein
VLKIDHHQQQQLSGVPLYTIVFRHRIKRTTDECAADSNCETMFENVTQKDDLQQQQQQ